jgi:hypothetical protein
MRRLLVGGVLALAVLSLGATAADASTPASAQIKQDRASTKAFIALQERADVNIARSAPAITAREKAYVTQAQSDCPDALTGIPKKAKAMQARAVGLFVIESSAALELVALAPVSALTGRIAAQTQRLRFSDPALQWQVQVNASAEAAYLKLRPPDLCADARALAARHFTDVTPAGARFAEDAVTVIERASVPASQLVRLMRQYAPGPVAVALKRLPELDRTVGRKLALGSHYRALLRALGASRLDPTASARPGLAS